MFSAFDMSHDRFRV